MNGAFSLFRSRRWWARTVAAAYRQRSVPCLRSDLAGQAAFVGTTDWLFTVLRRGGVDASWVLRVVHIAERQGLDEEWKVPPSHLANLARAAAHLMTFGADRDGALACIEAAVVLSRRDDERWRLHGADGWHGQDHVPQALCADCSPYEELLGRRPDKLPLCATGRDHRPAIQTRNRQDAWLPTDLAEVGVGVGAMKAALTIWRIVRSADLTVALARAGFTPATTFAWWTSVCRDGQPTRDRVAALVGQVDTLAVLSSPAR